MALTGARRRAALAVRRKMNSGDAGPGRRAVARPVERKVGPHLALRSLQQELDLDCLVGELNLPSL